ncbi:MogA/MoaB family molybdenum cofactor biosynthesis protein [Desertibacillus haloalkaliphilus]|uniref:MogA/MoaB family molybdenum cofactor biosynthesis protein n=1 Tax=Desertibacillus haloalkaliphilus TaxID=1328930 RepID=UPI001C25ADB9|nr:MogA/MoaB family molybdenum cofactor biosynthesis protein [Desertibacillus haloalkaliphilus]MBU8907179.1 MogA/MoaB family molybdenum cofactor biosynthesis protein [Desertibacillus haloalkaliphilus]
MSVEEHKKQAASSVKCMIITVSDTRTKETDKSGKLIMKLLEDRNNEVSEYQIVKDEYDDIRSLLHRASERNDVDAVLLNGGTGISFRDTTYEAVRDSLDKEIPGFGELFRYLSYAEDIGSAAILSRAIAGICKHTAIFSMPGSSGAVSLAMNRLILPELTHVLREVNKDRR